MFTHSPFSKYAQSPISAPCAWNADGHAARRAHLGFRRLYVLVIPARSDASLKDAAWKFIRWAASEEGQRYVMQMSDVPNQTSLAMSDDYYEIGGGKNYWASPV